MGGFSPIASGEERESCLDGDRTPLSLNKSFYPCLTFTEILCSTQIIEEIVSREGIVRFRAPLLLPFKWQVSLLWFHLQNDRSEPPPRTSAVHRVIWKGAEIICWTTEWIRLICNLLKSDTVRVLSVTRVLPAEGRRFWAWAWAWQYSICMRSPGVKRSSSFEASPVEAVDETERRDGSLRMKYSHKNWPKQQTHQRHRNLNLVL